VKVPALALTLVLAALLRPAVAAAQAPAPDGIGVDEHLGATLPQDLPFMDHEGRAVTLHEYFDGERPVIVVFGYHSCPMLCGLIQGAVVDALRGASWSVGRELDVVVVSIDPRDTPDVAAARRAVILSRYEAARGPGWAPAGRDRGWHYLVGTEGTVRALTAAAGYRYAYDSVHEQYGHPAVVIVATPAGKIARYLYGAEFRPDDVRYALLEASLGRSVSTVDRILLYCVHYDRASGRYGLVVSRIMTVGGAAIAVLLGSLLAILWRRERRGARVRRAPAESTS
jgi:protein SCO1/2